MSNDNINFKYIRNLLDDGKFELMSVYEHGLSNFSSSRFYDSFKQISDKFSEAGLSYGAEKFKELADISSSMRFETDKNRKPDKIILLIAEIWNYTGICADRLNFYEILDELNDDTDNIKA